MPARQVQHEDENRECPPPSSESESESESSVWVGEFALTLGGGLISMPTPEPMLIPITDQRFFLGGSSSG
jgi:hypothetical protein